MLIVDLLSVAQAFPMVWSFLQHHYTLAAIGNPCQAGIQPHGKPIRSKHILYTWASEKGNYPHISHVSFFLRTYLDLKIVVDWEIPRNGL